MNRILVANAQKEKPEIKDELLFTSQWGEKERKR